jgi:hypothetical protein
MRARSLVQTIASFVGLDGVDAKADSVYTSQTPHSPFLTTALELDTRVSRDQRAKHRGAPEDTADDMLHPDHACMLEYLFVQSACKQTVTTYNNVV